ncbi:hypothetical protein [Micromonospora sp. NPDC049204]|uniref:hypothetical protein n=1 Tax=Micromonospora sp. NPDC049204 TaxID=3154351 RepID=UPI003411ACFB
MPSPTTDRVVRCRYKRRNDEMCTAAAVEPDGDVLLCTKHLARAITLIRVATARSAK